MSAVHLHVGDLTRTDAFYHRALGLDKTVWSYPGALFFSAGGYHHHLGTNIWSPGPSARADEARLLEWELVVPERSQTNDVAERLRAGAYVVNDAPAGVRTSDPWGTQVYIRMEEGDDPESLRNSWFECWNGRGSRAVRALDSMARRDGHARAAAQDRPNGRRMRRRMPA